MRQRINKATLKKLAIFMILLPILVSVAALGYRRIIQQRYGQFVFDADGVPATQVALVFGAGVYEDGRLSDMLRDRMDVAIELYNAGKVEKLLLSGDNRFENYDEPTAMMEYAIENGVAEADIQPDFGGRRTYDSCYRAKHIFQVDEAILVTQYFHLPRALMNCQKLGIETIGVSADLNFYVDARYLAVREIAATLQSTWDLVWEEPPPVMGDVIQISE